ncbi:MAG: acetate/propionate family kinase [Anaerolineae bacterium]|nr:acetate/propionate family kinase [Anaerolineae bacterium]
MKVLVFNCGSSSLNYKVFDIAKERYQLLASGKAHRVGVTSTQAAFLEHHGPKQNKKIETQLPNHQVVAQMVLDQLESESLGVDAVGHRFVHGGNYFRQSVILTPENKEKLKACLPLAPIHNPNSFRVIQVCMQRLPGIPEYVTFDTAFHATLPPHAYTYPLPQELIDRFGYRKFGFHGLSYAYVISRAAELMELSISSARIIACHLGTGGSSVLAYQNGAAVDTSMGFSPLPGLVMSTRTGDLDPILPLFLLDNLGCTPEDLEIIFNKKSGLLGVSGFSSDLRDLQDRIAQDGYPPAILAYEMAVHRIKKYIGAYGVLMGGLDVLIFTDDIGVHNWKLREAVCNGLQWLGIDLDLTANQNYTPNQNNLLSTPSSKVKIITMPTDEEWVIASEGNLLLQGQHADF